ncbi:hypothetical protein BDF14DRAFT_1805388 [Spinellus fusiger]|nr:hypothetical protein BDF14DRAFT_1805388 [Spinellus fusiger]
MTSLFLANYESNLGITNGLVPDKLISLPFSLPPTLIFVLAFVIIIRLFYLII